MYSTTINLEAGIRFGVIDQGDVLQAWCDYAEARYTKVCGFCGTGLDEDIEEGETCPHCEELLEQSEDLYPDSPDCFYLEDSDYLATQNGEETAIFIERSPFYTRKDGPKTYCFGHDWFDDGIAPYPVYSRATDEIVLPE